MLNCYIEKGIIPVSSKHGIGHVVFSPLAQGIVTGYLYEGRAVREDLQRIRNYST